MEGGGSLNQSLYQALTVGQEATAGEAQAQSPGDQHAGVVLGVTIAYNRSCNHKQWCGRSGGGMGVAG